MKFYEWLGELDAVQVRLPDRQFNGFWMVEGKPVIGWNEYLIGVYLCPETPVFDFGLARNAWPLFSPRMRTFIEDAIPDAIQFLPFRFQRPDGSGQIADYSVGQILLLVDCLDRTRTKVRNNWEPINGWGDFGTYRPMVVSRSLVGDNRLFRIKGCCRSIVIREELKNAIEDAGFQGQRFDYLECSE